jgi:hypothetical protein
LLAGRPVPPATFVRHEMITSANLRSFYPQSPERIAVPEATVPKD